MSQDGLKIMEKTMPSEYFINSQSKIYKIISKVLKKNKQIKAIALMIFKIFTPLIIRVKSNLKLKKFFKY